MISDLVKGVGNLDPARMTKKPRYEVTWDIAPVLTFLAALFPPTDLSFMQLSMKTLALTALATISRSSTLNILSRHWQWKPNPDENQELQLFLYFLPNRMEKTGRNRDGVFVRALSDHPALDPVQHLQHYLQISGNHSGSSTDISSPLWLSTRPPYQPVKPVTLARWFKAAMSGGGIDLEVFKPHSVRAAAAAHARTARSLSLTQVLARGGWKPSADGASAVFLKYYDKNVVSTP
jgi:hypothetical protein